MRNTDTGNAAGYTTRGEKLSTAQLLVATGFSCLKRHRITGEYYGVKKHLRKIKQVRLKTENDEPVSERRRECKPGDLLKYVPLKRVSQTSFRGWIPWRGTPRAPHRARNSGRWEPGQFPAVKFCGRGTVKIPCWSRPKPFAFVLKPFEAKFEDIYTLGIKAACDKAGA